MGDERAEVVVAPLGAGFGIGLLICAACEFAVAAVPPISIQGGFFTTDWAAAAGPLHLVLAAVLAVLGAIALVRRKLPAITLFALIPVLAVAAAEGVLAFYGIMRSVHHVFSDSPRPSTNVAVWAYLAVALVGFAIVFAALPRARAMLVWRLDRTVGAVAPLCATALAVALLSNRFDGGFRRHGEGALFNLDGARGIQAAITAGYGCVVLAVVIGGALVAAALGRSRPTALLLLGVAFAAIFNDDYSIISLDVFRARPPFLLLLAGVGTAALLARWCWRSDRELRQPAQAELAHS